MPFLEDSEYIVYADGDLFGEPVGGLFTHSCGRTSLFPNESERMALGAPCTSGQALIAEEGRVCGEFFRRGDANTDGGVDLSDAISV